MPKRYTLIEARTLLGFHDDNKKLDRWMAKLKIVPLLLVEVPFEDLDIGQQDRRMKFITHDELECLASALGVPLSPHEPMFHLHDEPQEGDAGEIAQLQEDVAELREEVKKLKAQLNETPRAKPTAPPKDTTGKDPAPRADNLKPITYTLPVEQYEAPATPPPPAYGSLATGYMQGWERPTPPPKRRREGSGNPPLPDRWESLNAFAQTNGIPDTDVRRWRDLRIVSFHAGKWMPRKGAKPVEYALDPEQQQELLQIANMPDYERALLIKDARARLANRGS